MTSLTEAYGSKGQEGLRRLYLGTGLFVLGAVMVVIAIVAATTNVFAASGLGTFGARKLAGILAGLGIPAVFIGIFTVLPASRNERAAAAIGASVAVFGVLLFAYAYPGQWYGATENHITLPVVAVYFLGAIITFWALFTAVVNFKVRNAPGGTVTLENIIRAGRSTDRRTSGSKPEGNALGGVGVVGNVDRETVMSESDDGGTSTASDGGTAASSPDAEDAVVERTTESRPARNRPDRPTAEPDRYCGSCAYFDYARTDEGIKPYCGYDDQLMDDMEPCDHWQPNSPP